MAGDSEPNYLFNTITSHLKDTGCFREIRCQLQSRIINMMRGNLEKGEALCGASVTDGFVGGTDKNGVLHGDTRVALLNQLIMEYLHWYGYKYTAQMLAMETGSEDLAPKRENLEEVLGPFKCREVPIMLEVVAQMVEGKGERMRRNGIVVLRKQSPHTDTSSDAVTCPDDGSQLDESFFSGSHLYGLELEESQPTESEQNESTIDESICNDLDADEFNADESNAYESTTDTNSIKDLKNIMNFRMLRFQKSLNDSTRVEVDSEDTVLSSNDGPIFANTEDYTQSIGTQTTIFQPNWQWFKEGTASSESDDENNSSESSSVESVESTYSDCTLYKLFNLKNQQGDANVVQKEKEENEKQNESANSNLMPSEVASNEEQNEIREDENEEELAGGEEEDIDESTEVPDDDEFSSVDPNAERVKNKQVVKYFSVALNPETDENDHDDDFSSIDLTAKIDVNDHEAYQARIRYIQRELQIAMMARLREAEQGQESDSYYDESDYEAEGEGEESDAEKSDAEKSDAEESDSGESEYENAIENDIEPGGMEGVEEENEVDIEFNSQDDYDPDVQSDNFSEVLSEFDSLDYEIQEERQEFEEYEDQSYDGQFIQRSCRETEGQQKENQNWEGENAEFQPYEYEEQEEEEKEEEQEDEEEEE